MGTTPRTAIEEIIEALITAFQELRRAFAVMRDVEQDVVALELATRDLSDRLRDSDDAIATLSRRIAELEGTIPEP